MTIDLETLLPLAMIAAGLILAAYAALTHRSPAMTMTTPPTNAPGLIGFENGIRTYATSGTHRTRSTDPVYVLHLDPDEALTLAHMLEIAYQADAVHATKHAGRLLAAAQLMAGDVINSDRAGRRGGRS